MLKSRILTATNWSQSTWATPPLAQQNFWWSWLRLETVNAICSRCPKGISLEENFVGWKKTSSPLIWVFLLRITWERIRGVTVRPRPVVNRLRERYLSVLVTVGIDVRTDNH